MKYFFSLLIMVLTAKSNLFSQYIDFEADGIAYVVTSYTFPYTVKVVENTAIYEGDVYIPISVNYDNYTYIVTEISSNAFKNCNINTLYLSDSIVFIDDDAFSSYSNIVSLNVDQNNNYYKGIGNILYDKNQETLIKCFGFQEYSVVIPNTVTKIKKYAFYLIELSSIVLPNSIEEIEDRAFMFSKGFDHITIPSSLKFIGDEVFSCSELKSITFLNKMSEIGENTFGSCSYLYSIIMPDSIEKIGGGVFNGCQSLLSINIPNTVTSIGDYAFSGCRSLVSFSIPNSVTTIGNHTFYNCEKLDSIKIPNSVYSIGSNVFEGCSNLDTIKVPNSVINIGEGAFIDCSSLKSIDVDIDNPKYLSIDGVLYDKDTLTLICFPEMKIIYHVINSKRIFIPKTIKKIKSHAFNDCTYLNLTSIICNITQPPILEINAFNELQNNNTILYVPFSSIDLYKQAAQWNDFIIKGIIPNFGSGDYLVSGNIYLDENSNKMKDNNESGMINQELLILPDSIYTGTDENGNYYFRADSGSYKVKLLLKDNWQLITDSVSYKIIVNNSDTSGFDFGVKGINEETKLETYITSLDGGRCFEPAPFYLTYKNIGTTVSSGLLTLNVDEKLKDILSSESAYDSVSTDTSFVYWNYTNLKPFEERKIKLRIRMPDFTSMGDTLISVIKIDNGISVQGSDTSKIVVRCSYDPNDKLVYPEGVYEEKYVLMDETLNYTIRFQNTGNDTAYQVIVIDTLDSSLDLNTFEVLASSHNLQTSYNTNGIIEFRFDSIMLVDSTTNQPESQGFVKYKIKAKSGLEDNTVVKNTGYIYFDSNPPVITNTTINTMTYNIEKDGIAEKQNETDKVNFYPNPFSQTAKLEFENKNNEPYQLQITDITGKLLQSQQSKSNVMIIEKGNMPSGMYFYKLQNALTKESYNGKFVVE